MKKYFAFACMILLVYSCNRNKYNYDASGTFEATEVIVSAEANGKLKRFEAEEGMRVRAHEELGFIDTTQLYLKKLQLLSSVKAVGSRRLDIPRQIAATKEQVATQQREKKRVEKLIAADAANTKQLDDINSYIAVLESQLAAQKESLEKSNQSVSAESSSVEIQVAQVEDMLSKSRIQSPIDGTILVKYAEQGELTSVGRPLFKVADIEEMTLRAYIVSGQMNQLKIGQQVRVFTDYGASGSRDYTGVVKWISDQAEFTPKTIQTKDERENLVYAIKVSVKNDGFIKIGMYGDIKFE